MWYVLSSGVVSIPLEIIRENIGVVSYYLISTHLYITEIYRRCLDSSGKYIALLLSIHRLPAVPTESKAPFQSYGINFSFLLNFSYMN
jgi:hypothetical protein